MLVVYRSLLAFSGKSKICHLRPFRKNIESFDLFESNHNVITRSSDLNLASPRVHTLPVDDLPSCRLSHPFLVSSQVARMPGSAVTDLIRVASPSSFVASRASNSQKCEQSLTAICGCEICCSRPAADTHHLRADLVV